MKTIFTKAFLLTAVGALVMACGGKEAKKAATTEVDETTTSKTKMLDIEKPQLTFGGFFEEEGLFVSVEAQSNWKNVLDRVIDGQLDGSHMLAGQPIAAGAGFGRQAQLVTPFSMDLNGNGITVSNVKPVITDYKNSGKPFKMGMVFPVSTHNYEIRYWLAAAGIHPGMYTADNVQGQIDAEVLLSVTPPPQMQLL